MWEILLLCRRVVAVASARRRAVSELDVLGGRLLADIGLDRADIAAYVRSGWPWPASPFTRRPRLRQPLRGCG